jgi:hypothetical protein
VLLAIGLALAGSASAAPVTPFGPDSVSRAIGWANQSDEFGWSLVQYRGRGGGGGQSAANRANRAGGFNSSDFHQNISNTRNLNTGANRNVNVNGNRNVNVNGNRNVNVNGNRNVYVSGHGGCCYGNYNEGPSWGGVAAGVAVGAVVGAAAHSAASSPTYAAPPPTYPPGYVTPPPY